MLPTPKSVPAGFSYFLIVEMNAKSSKRAVSGGARNFSKRAPMWAVTPDLASGQSPLGFTCVEYEYS